MSGYYGASGGGGSTDAGDLASGVVAHERGGLEVDASAYAGLVKIASGTTSQATAGTDYSLPATVTTGATASTTQTQGQGAITLGSGVTQHTHVFATVANALDTGTLPSCAAGLVVCVVNDGVASLQIFPASGDDLGAGVNTAIVIEADDSRTFVGLDATSWRVIG